MPANRRDTVIQTLSGDPGDPEPFLQIVAQWLSLSSISFQK